MSKVQSIQPKINWPCIASVTPKKNDPTWLKVMKCVVYLFTAPLAGLADIVIKTVTCEWCKAAPKPPEKGKLRKMWDKTTSFVNNHKLLIFTGGMAIAFGGFAWYKGGVVEAIKTSSNVIGDFGRNHIGFDLKTWSWVAPKAPAITVVATNSAPNVLEASIAAPVTGSGIPVNGTVSS